MPLNLLCPAGREELLDAGAGVGVATTAELGEWERTRGGAVNSEVFGQGSTGDLGKGDPSAAGFALGQKRDIIGERDCGALHTCIIAPEEVLFSRKLTSSTL